MELKQERFISDWTIIHIYTTLLDLKRWYDRHTTKFIFSLFSSNLLSNGNSHPLKHSNNWKVKWLSWVVVLRPVWDYFKEKKNDWGWVGPKSIFKRHHFKINGACMKVHRLFWSARGFSGDISGQAIVNRNSLLHK